MEEAAEPRSEGGDENLRCLLILGYLIYHQDSETSSSSLSSVQDRPSYSLSQESCTRGGWTTTTSCLPDDDELGGKGTQMVVIKASFHV